MTDHWAPLVPLRRELAAAIVALDAAGPSARWDAYHRLQMARQAIWNAAKVARRREVAEKERSARIAAIAELSAWWDGPGSEGRSV